MIEVSVFSANIIEVSGIDYIMKKIYLDMDGVLSDFHKRFVDLFGHHPNEVKGSFTKSSQWKTFVENDNFATLDWFEGGQDLLKYLQDFDVPVEILSSSGGDMYYEEIAEQKTRWLRNNKIYFPVNIVPGKRFKKDYADPRHILIDDTERNIVEFIEAGGLAILHKRSEDTAAELEYMLCFDPVAQ